MPYLTSSATKLLTTWFRFWAGIPGRDQGAGLTIGFKLIDRFGVPIRNASVRFGVASGGGAIDQADATTDVFGIAAALVNLGPQMGEQQFTAQAGGLN